MSNNFLIPSNNQANFLIDPQSSAVHPKFTDRKYVLGDIEISDPKYNLAFLKFQIPNKHMSTSVPKVKESPRLGYFCQILLQVPEEYIVYNRIVSYNKRFN